MVNFHGFELPIWYSSIQEEHLATRNSAGLFDVSHMGTFRFVGDDVRNWLSSVSTQDYSKFEPGRCGYSHFLDNDGNIIDDIIFAVSSDSEVFGVPNSTMAGVVLEWLTENLPNDDSVKIEDLSDETAIIALQGPKSPDAIVEVLGEDNCPESFGFQKISENNLLISGWIQGTGYTGERGFEIFVPNDEATVLWNAIISHPKVTPVGLGARDTLRLEKGYLLSGQDFAWSGSEGLGEGFPDGYLIRSTPETAVPFGLDMNHEFIGREGLERSINSETILWGIECLGKGPSPRPGHRVFIDSEDSEIIGFVTSGGPSPSKNMVGIALAYLRNRNDGDEVWIQSSRRRRVRSRVMHPPFV